MGTVDNWVSTTHAFLEFFHLDIGPWSYEQLVAQMRQEFSSDGDPHNLWTHKRHLTGHSLGGGIAQVVAALTESNVFAISPPGLLQSFKKHAKDANATYPTSQSSARSAHHKSVSIVVEGDWVSRFDTHGGFVQTVGCERSDLAPFGSCHLLESTICHLLEACGDSRQRWHQCNHTFEPIVEGMQLLSTLPEQAMSVVRQCGVGSSLCIEWLLRVSVAALCAGLAWQLVALS